MKFFSRLFQAIKQLKKTEAEESTARMLTDNPLNIELIARIAKEYAYTFEIVQKDGTVLRFYKPAGMVTEDPSAKEFW